MMVEGDVLLKGQGTDLQQMLPVMSHPLHPDNSLPFTDWLDIVVGSGKGLKIDFKSIESVELCLQSLNHVKPPVKNEEFQVMRV